MSVAIKKKAGQGKPVDWSVAKLDYITENLHRTGRGEPYTLKDVAKKWGVSYGQARNIAARDKWNAELAARQEARNNSALEKVQAYEQFNEAEIRSRQARYSRLAMGKAMQRLSKLDPEKLTVKEAIELLKLGLVEERKALGLPDAFTFTPPPQNEEGQYGSVIDHVNRQAQLQALGGKLLEFVERKQQEH